jgi:hypothetical protein
MRSGIRNRLSMCTVPRWKRCISCHFRAQGLKDSPNGSMRQKGDFSAKKVPFQCIINLLEFGPGHCTVSSMDWSTKYLHTYRAVSGVFQNIDPPPTSPPSECFLPAPGGEGGGGSIFWKTPDIGLASYSIISLRTGDFQVGGRGWGQGKTGRVTIRDIRPAGGDRLQVSLLVSSII